MAKIVLWVAIVVIAFLMPQTSRRQPVLADRPGLACHQRVAGEQPPQRDPDQRDLARPGGLRHHRSLHPCHPHDEGGLLVLAGADLSGLFSAFIALLLAYPFLKVKGIYFSILTLLTAETFRLVAFYLELSHRRPAGAHRGAGPWNTERPVPRREIDFDRPYNYYYIAVGVVLIALLILYYFERAYISFQWRAIRDDNTLAGAVGINVIGYKMVNFVLAAFMAGISGALFASYQHNLSARRHVPLRRDHVDLSAGVHGGGGQGLLHRPARGHDGSHPAGREHSFHAAIPADDHRRHRHRRHALHADGSRWDFPPRSRSGGGEDARDRRRRSQAGGGRRRARAG